MNYYAFLCTFVSFVVNSSVWAGISISVAGVLFQFVYYTLSFVLFLWQTYKNCKHFTFQSNVP
ncbi:MAG: hypothetical protein DRR42_26230 [Gammaproteobacteria bacterium]|nr:MAG: hypothetical protein DRR42_26230 [Gammaproteobacteria bacterium]